jgi:hypothetical protein
LHIEASDPRIKIVDTDGTNWESEVFTQGGALKLQQSEYARFNSVGNFGIGTTSPSQKLEVAGVIPKIYINSSNNTGGSIIFDDNLSTGTEIQGTQGNVIFKQSGSEKMRINSSGNVGIGATSPTSQLGSTKVLDISSTGNGEIILDHTDAGVSSDIGLYSWNRNNDHLAHIKASCDGATDSAFISFHAQATGGSFGLPTANERMRITSTGNVGIGTTTPSVALEVSGEIDVVGGDGYRIDTKPFANWGLDLLTLGDWDGEGYETRFMGSNSSEVMRVTDTKVGIGTTAPSQKLHVAGTGLFSSTLYLGDTNCALFRYFNSLVITSSGGTSITLGGGPGNVNNNVFVGNGYLDVNGYIRGKNYFYLEDAAGTLRTTLRSESTYATLDNGTNTLNTIANAHIFLRSTTEIMRVHTNNNVGIGVTLPESKLQVNGGVQLANDTDLPSASKVGTFRYYTSGNNSYVDMCMQTGAATYAWVNIVTNSW